ncbi:sensor histidine kinase [Nocardiopsis metallicus]|uniref:histidine kinase n=1 Tax=Nocardiopsis metallicus TaxID=179819 RepID=A0A840W2B6_9ACTN|nr:nitrate- and nitrite sensing domain-containing protein [Nocardiopsis metallicus]MBB5490192.1 signal transduction histidine kinase [Nocardiopsis metallicus]
MPHEKRTSLRARMITLVLIPSTALLALWAVFTTVLAFDIRDLRATTTLIDEVGAPVVDAITQLQRERHATMAAIDGPSTGDTERLETARAATDQANEDLTLALAQYDRDELPPQVLAFQRQLNLINRHREEVLTDLSPEVDTLQVAGYPFTRTIETGLEIWDAQVDHADIAISPQLRSLASVLRTREFLSRQDAILAHSTATDTFTPDAHTQFAAAAGAQRHTWAQVESAPGSRRSPDSRNLTGSSWMNSVHRLQDIVISNPGGPDTRVPVDAQTWSEANAALDERMREVEQGRMAQIVELGHAQTRDLLISALVISVIALAAALASVVIAVTGSQRLGRRLQALRSHTLHHARFRLPQVTARLRAGHSVDVDAETPRFAEVQNDELGQVAEAFNDAQRAAVVSAVEEAQVRAGVRNMFRNIARRTQSLVHRQLALLDRLERTETDPEVLESLFRIDHFSTQMRRNAENLMLLSGDRPTRREASPVGLHEAVRAAASEIEDYARVQVLVLPQVALSGAAGSDLVRLIAELLENAASFSPPGTEVIVSGRTLESGEHAGEHVVQVQDSGLGMTAGQLENANALLGDPPRFDLGRMREDSQLGLYVVATIASRHGFGVELRASPYEGTRALVRIPASAVVEQVRQTGPMRRVGLAGPGGGQDSPVPSSPTVNPVAGPASAPGPAPGQVGSVVERVRPGRHRAAENTRLPSGPDPDEGNRTSAGLPARTAGATYPGHAAAPVGTPGPPEGPRGGSPGAPDGPNGSGAQSQAGGSGRWNTPGGPAGARPGVPEAFATPSGSWFPAERFPAEDGGESGVPTPSPADTGDTYKGLPRRRRRRVPAVPPQSGAHNNQATGGQRPLSEIRSMMSAFQAGTERGRAESLGVERAQGGLEQGSHHDESSER